MKELENMSVRDQLNYLIKVKKVMRAGMLAHNIGLSESHMCNMLSGTRSVTHLEEMARELGFKVVLIPIESDEDKSEE